MIEPDTPDGAVRVALQGGARHALAAPAHGFARIRDWRLVERTPTSLALSLESDAESSRWT